MPAVSEHPSSISSALQPQLLKPGQAVPMEENWLRARSSEVSAEWVLDTAALIACTSFPDRPESRIEILDTSSASADESTEAMARFAKASSVQPHGQVK